MENIHLNFKKLNQKAAVILTLVRLTLLSPLFNVDCRFGCRFMLNTAWRGFLGSTSSDSEGGGILATFKQLKSFPETFYENISSVN